MHKDYAIAIREARAKEGASDETIVAGLVRHLQATGRMKLLPGIVRELTRLEARAQKQQPTLEVAREEEKSAAEAALKTMGITPTTTTVNTSLIRGWRARAGGTLIDRSAKQSLIDIYQKITN